MKSHDMHYVHCNICGGDDTKLVVTDVTERNVKVQGEYKKQVHAQGIEICLSLCAAKEQLKLLDFGCGNGGFIPHAISAGFKSYGCDISPVQIEYARKAYPQAQFSADGIPEEIFDIVTMWDVIEHLKNPSSVLTELRQHLTPEGILYIRTPNITGQMFKVRVLKPLLPNKTYFIPHEHIYHFSPKTIRRLLENCGYDVVSIGISKPEKTLNPRQFIRIVYYLGSRFLKFLTGINTGFSMVVAAKPAESPK